MILILILIPDMRTGHSAYWSLLLFTFETETIYGFRLSNLSNSHNQIHQHPILFCIASKRRAGKSGLSIQHHALITLHLQALLSLQVESGHVYSKQESNTTRTVEILILWICCRERKKSGEIADATNDLAETTFAFLSEFQHISTYFNNASQIFSMLSDLSARATPVAGSR